MTSDLQKNADRIYKETKSEWDAKIAASADDPERQKFLQELSDMMLPGLRRNLDSLAQAGEDSIRRIRRS